MELKRILPQRKCTPPSWGKCGLVRRHAARRQRTTAVDGPPCGFGAMVIAGFSQAQNGVITPGAPSPFAQVSNVGLHSVAPIPLAIDDANAQRARASLAAAARAWLAVDASGHDSSMIRGGRPSGPRMPRACDCGVAFACCDMRAHFTQCIAAQSFVANRPRPSRARERISF